MDATPIISADLDSLLDDVQQRTFRYFWDGAHAQSGLPYDKCLLDGTLRLLLHFLPELSRCLVHLIHGL